MMIRVVGIRALTAGRKADILAAMPPSEEKPPIDSIRHALYYWTQEEAASRLHVTDRTIRRWLVAESAPQWAPAVIERELLRERRPSNPTFTFIDLFAGIGGFRRGFETLNGQCVFTSEWDRYAVRTYKANFPDTEDIHGDITAVDPESIPDHDILLAGFPCQPFSLAGVSKKNSLGRAHGFRDKAQGTLFFNIVDILDRKRPRAFLLENVKNLRSHDGGRTFAVITGALRELGYHVHQRLINASAWVPQGRERVFLAGFRDSVNFSFDDLDIPDKRPILGDVLHNSTETPEPPFTMAHRGRTVVNPRYTLSDHLWQYLQAYAAKHREKGNGFGCSVVGRYDTARTLSARYHKDGSEILVAQARNNPRRLTPRECARLMGFDTPGRKPFAIPVSDTQAYRQFGNAVVPLVVEAIAKLMVPMVLDPAAYPAQRVTDEQGQFSLSVEAA
jgi:DNA (cytosine-5)-methyltransferase 1